MSWFLSHKVGPGPRLTLLIAVLIVVFALRGLCLPFGVPFIHPLPLASSSDFSSRVRFSLLLWLVLLGIGERILGSFPCFFLFFTFYCENFQIPFNLKKVIRWTPIYPPTNFSNHQLIPIFSLSHTVDYFKLSPKYHKISSINLSVVSL